MNLEVGWISRSKCPICGLAGEVRYMGVTDKAYHVPGEWCYRQHRSCDVLWLDPTPANYSTVATLYPADYPTHVKPEPENLLASRQGRVANLRLRIKSEILRHAYGYTIECRDKWVCLLGRIAAAFPIMRRWAGYTVRFLHARNGRLLDVGCGNGTFLMLMARLGWEVMGIEPDPTAAAYAHSQGLKVEVGMLEEVRLEPESFDAITLSHVIEHLLDPVVSLKVLARALKPGGVLVSISPNPDGVLSRIFGPSWRELDPPRHLVLFGPRAMANLARMLGLRPIVWTTNRNANWVAQESISIKRYSNAFAYRGKLLPAMLKVFCMLFIPFGIGEEVVLVAKKE